MDNLNTHGIASLYEAFTPAEAFALAQRLEIHHTPKHGSWLNTEFLTPTAMTGALAVDVPARARSDARFDRALIVNDARDAARFACQISETRISTSALDHISSEIRRFATGYFAQPLSELFMDIRALRGEVFNLVENNRFPDQMRNLCLAASRLGGLQRTSASTLATIERLIPTHTPHSCARSWLATTQCARGPVACKASLPTGTGNWTARCSSSKTAPAVAHAAHPRPDRPQSAPGRQRRRVKAGSSE
ncbi:transposase [Kibdelosporangium persicum]